MVTASTNCVARCTETAKIKEAMSINDIRHLVVLMLENRSFDNLLGFLYDRQERPRVRVPHNDEAIFFGLDFDPGGGAEHGGDYWNPSNRDFFATPPAPALKVPIMPAAVGDFRSPKPDPGEHFDRITAQIFGPGVPAIAPNHRMLGFVLDYAHSAGSAGADDIMRYYQPSQVPVIASLGRNFAVCDRWFAACPTQTLPNRAFAHTGTSCGKVNNWPYDPFDYNVPTIFNVLEESQKAPWGAKLSWKVYKDSHLHGFERIPVTRVQFPQLWNPNLNDHFRHLEDFQQDVRSGTLPTYSFIEPRLLIDGNDQHPPRDIRPGEQLIYDVYESIRRSDRRAEILLLITYDEHGGCYDHVPPPFGAVAPDERRKEPLFNFNRYGVRVPAILVSPYIEQGTVFRSAKHLHDNLESQYDHTSILATLRDWLAIPSARMLSSKRVAGAPTFANVLTRPSPREMPKIAVPVAVPIAEKGLHASDPVDDLEMSLAIGLMHWANQTSGLHDQLLMRKLLDRNFLITHLTELARRLPV